MNKFNVNTKEPRLSAQLDGLLITPLRTVHLDVHIEEEEYFIDIHKMIFKVS